MEDVAESRCNDLKILSPTRGVWVRFPSPVPPRGKVAPVFTLTFWLGLNAVDVNPLVSAARRGKA
jgi:hypothetical protein